MQPLHLQIDGDLSPTATTKAAGLAELAPQFAIGAFQQGRGTHEFAGDATEPIESNGLLKIPLQRRHRFWGLLLPSAGEGAQALARLDGRLGLINATGLRKPLLTRLSMRLSGCQSSRALSASTR